MTYTPLRNVVLCQPITTEETQPGGRIILLEASREAQTSEQAEVVAVGPDVPDLKAGDWILHRPHTRREGPEGMFLLSADDVIAVLEVA